MALATLTNKGQVTIAKAIRESLGLQSGDKLEPEESRFLLRKQTKKLNRKCGRPHNEGFGHECVVRFLVKDDEKQAKAVYRIFKQTESKAEAFFVPTLVVLETVWVLDSVYETTRQEIVESIGELLLMPILEFEAQSAIRGFVSSARENNANLSDLLIAHYAKYSGCDSVITFDKRAAKLELFELLK